MFLLDIICLKPYNSKCILDKGLRSINTYNVSDAWYGNVKSEYRYVINRFETNQNKWPFYTIIQTIFNSVNFFYLLNCHNHSYSLQSVTYLYLCHNDVNCLRFRGAYLFAGRIKEQKFQISTRFQNENNNPLSSLNKIYVFTS